MKLFPFFFAIATQSAHAANSMEQQTFCTRYLSSSDVEYDWGIEEEPSIPSNMTSLLSPQSLKLSQKKTVYVTMQGEDFVVMACKDYCAPHLEPIPALGRLLSIEIAQAKKSSSQAPTYVSIIGDAGQAAYEVVENSILQIPLYRLPDNLNYRTETWTIKSIVEPDNSSQKYFVTISGYNGKTIEATGFAPEEIERLQEYLGLKSAADLNGYRFRTPFDLQLGTGVAALTYHLSLFRTADPANPQPPSYRALYEHALRSFAEGRIPRYSPKYNQAVIKRAFVAAFENPKWLELFGKRLANESAGRIKLVSTQLKKTPTGGRFIEMNFDYSGRSRQVLFYPEAQPFFEHSPTMEGRLEYSPFR